jgi:hypothetical protein
MIDFFSNPSALLKKAKNDFSQISINKETYNLNHSELMNWYSIFNTILDINHLFDWVLKNDNYEEDYKRECVKIFNGYTDIKSIPYDFREHYDKNNFPQINNNQKLIRDICNNLKHYKIKKHTPDVTEKKQYLSVCSNKNMVCGNRKAVCGYYEEYQFILKDNNANEIDVYKLLQNILDEWDMFLTQCIFEYDDQPREHSL